MLLQEVVSHSLAQVHQHTNKSTALLVMHQKGRDFFANKYDDHRLHEIRKRNPARWAGLESKLLSRVATHTPVSSVLLEEAGHGATKSFIHHYHAVHGRDPHPITLAKVNRLVSGNEHSDDEDTTSGDTTSHLLDGPTLVSMRAKHWNASLLAATSVSSCPLVVPEDCSIAKLWDLVKIRDSSPILISTIINANEMSKYQCTEFLPIPTTCSGNMCDSCRNDDFTFSNSDGHGTPKYINHLAVVSDINAGNFGSSTDYSILVCDPAYHNTFDKCMKWLQLRMDDPSTSYDVMVSDNTAQRVHDETNCAFPNDAAAGCMQRDHGCAFLTYTLEECVERCITLAGCRAIIYSDLSVSAINNHDADNEFANCGPLRQKFASLQKFAYGSNQAPCAYSQNSFTDQNGYNIKPTTAVHPSTKQYFCAHNKIDRCFLETRTLFTTNAEFQHIAEEQFEKCAYAAIAGMNTGSMLYQCNPDDDNGDPNGEACQQGKALLMDAKGFAYNVANCYANIIRQRFIPESEDLLTDCRNMGLWNKGDDDSEFELPTKKKPSSITANEWENGYAPISDAAMTKMRTNYAGAADEVEIGLNKQKHCRYLGSNTFLTTEGDKGTELSRSSLTSAINSGEEVTVHATTWLQGLSNPSTTIATTFGQPLVTSCAVAASNDKHYKSRSDELEYAQHIADVIFTVAAFYLDIFEAMLSVMPFVGDGLAAGVAMFRRWSSSSSTSRAWSPVTYSSHSVSCRRTPPILPRTR